MSDGATFDRLGEDVRLPWRVWTDTQDATVYGWGGTQPYQDGPGRR